MVHTWILLLKLTLMQWCSWLLPISYRDISQPLENCRLMLKQPLNIRAQYPYVRGTVPWKGQKEIQAKCILSGDHMPPLTQMRKTTRNRDLKSTGSISQETKHWFFLLHFTHAFICHLSASPVIRISIDTSSFYFPASPQLCRQKNGFCHLSHSASTAREQCHRLSLI